MTTTNIWTRRGEEAEGDDFAANNRTPIARADLTSALSAHHAEDLALLAEEDRAEALDVMVAAYERAQMCRGRDEAYAAESRQPARAPSPRRIAAGESCRAADAAGDADALRRAQGEWEEACEEEHAACTLNDRRIYAADLLHAADADVRMFLARWADPDNTDPALSAKIDAAKAARADAQRALDEAEQELSAALTAERIEAEAAA